GLQDLVALRIGPDFQSALLLKTEPLCSFLLDPRRRSIVTCTVQYIFVMPGEIDDSPSLRTCGCPRPSLDDIPAELVRQTAHDGAAPGPQGTPRVSTLVVQPQNVLLTTELPGRTSAMLVSDVRPQVTGILQARRFVEGSTVQAGEVL